MTDLLRGPDLIARFLTDAGLSTYAELARRSGKSPTQISNWVNGKENPRSSTVADMARSLGLDPADYGAGEDEGVWGSAPVWFTVFAEQQAAWAASVEQRLPIDIEPVLIDIAERLARIERHLGIEA